MSEYAGSLISCPEIQGQLNEAFPTFQREPAPLTEFLLSPMNTDGVLQKSVSPGRGKSRRVELIYTPRPLESEVSTSRSSDCSSTNVAGEESEQYEVGDTVYEYRETMPMTQLRDKCEDNALYMARMVLRMMDVVTRKIETANYAQIALMKGKFATGIPGTIDGSDNYQVAMLDANGKFDYDAFQKVGTATKYTGYNSTPVVLGGFTTEAYFKTVNAGCCSTSGVDISALAAQYGMAVLTSYRADAAFGSDKFMTMEPRSIQMINWNEYEGERGIDVVDTETYKQTILIDPATGLPYDFKFYMDCDGQITITVRSYNKLVSLPVDMFKVGDRMRGVTFVNGFAIVNP